VTEWPGPELLAVYDPARPDKQPPNRPEASVAGPRNVGTPGKRPDRHMVEELANLGIYV